MEENADWIYNFIGIGGWKDRQKRASRRGWDAL